MTELVEAFRRPIKDTESRVLFRGTLVVELPIRDCLGPLAIDEGEPRID